MQHQREDDLTNTMAAPTAASTTAAAASSTSVTTTPATTSRRKRGADDSSVASIASIASGRSSKRSIRRQDSLNSVDSNYSLGIDDLVNNLEGIDVNYISSHHTNNNNNNNGDFHSLNIHDNYASTSVISNNSFSNSFSSAGRNNDSAASRLSSGMWSFSDLEPWTCQMCTFENEAIFTVCEMCGHCKQQPQNHHSNSSSSSTANNNNSMVNATFAPTVHAGSGPSVAEQSRAVTEAENIRILQEERLQQLARFNQPRALSPSAAAAPAALPVGVAASVEGATSSTINPLLPSSSTTTTSSTVMATNTSPRPPRNPTHSKAKRCSSPLQSNSSGGTRTPPLLFHNAHNAAASASTTIPTATTTSRVSTEDASASTHNSTSSTGAVAGSSDAHSSRHNRQVEEHGDDHDDDNFDDASFPSLHQWQWQQPLNASPRRYSPTSNSGVAKMDPQDSAGTATTFDMSSSSSTTFAGYYSNYPNPNVINTTGSSSTELPPLSGLGGKNAVPSGRTSSPPSSSSSSSSKKKTATDNSASSKPTRHQRFIDV